MIKKSDRLVMLDDDLEDERRVSYLIERAECELGLRSDDE